MTVLAFAAVSMLLACASSPPQGAGAGAATSAGQQSRAAPPGLGAAIRAALGGDWEAHYFDAVVDLNGDGAPEVLVYPAGPMVCGTGGCSVLVFSTDRERYRLVSQISVSRPPIRLSPRSHQGWRNLVVGIGGGAAAGNAELKFDGVGYPPNPTVPPAEPVSRLEGTEILIPDFGSFKEGKPVPPR